MKPHLWCIVALVGLALAVSGAALAEDLPGHYFKLMRGEVESLDPASLKHSPGAMLSAAVLYTKRHPANTATGDRRMLELALRLGDLYADQSEADTAENKQDYEWEIHFWLDTYRLLEVQLGEQRRARWRREIEKITGWFAAQVEYRIDFPRYQGPYIRTSTNHLALFASEVYLAGLALKNKEWEQLGARAMHRLAAEEQTPDGYWGEFTDNGPATGYNYITMTCVALYAEHSRDAAALDALRRATVFHQHFTWPNGTPVETIDGRNRHREVGAWGHFGFSHSPAGRRYAEFLAGFFDASKLPSRTLGRLAQSALYYHEGPTEPISQELPRSAWQMKVPAGIRKTRPWTVCYSGLIDAPIDSQFTLDRQGHLSVYHDQLGLIITGAGSKRQPELATFAERTADSVRTVPLSSRLRMNDDRDRLGLGYSTFFAELDVPTPKPDRLPLRFAITETGGGRLKGVTLNLQLCLKAGEVLETARSKWTLSEERLELSPDQLGGWIRHQGWTLHVDPAARLTWPVLPFNPYANAPEKELRFAVGALSVPVTVKPAPADAPLNWRRGEIAFSLEAPSDKTVRTDEAIRLQIEAVNALKRIDAVVYALKDDPTSFAIDFDEQSPSDDDLRRLRHIPNVVEINFGRFGKRLGPTDRQLVFLRDLTQLKSLCLSNTSITDQGLEELKHLKDLEFLDLAFTPVTFEAVVDLVRALPKLKWLYVTENRQITLEREQQLMKLRPGLTVIR